MAMIQCKECGANVSDAAPTCPSCGVAAPGGSCTLVFARKGLNGALIGMEVLVDGKPCGTLGPRGRVVVPVAPGTRQFEVRTAQGSSSSSTVDVSSGETVVTVGLNFMNRPKFS